MKHPSEMRFGVVRDAFGYSVIDKTSDKPDRTVAAFEGPTSRERAWADARRRERESDATTCESCGERNIAAAETCPVCEYERVPHG